MSICYALALCMYVMSDQVLVLVYDSISPFVCVHCVP